MAAALAVFNLSAASLCLFAMMPFGRFISPARIWLEKRDRKRILRRKGESCIFVEEMDGVGGGWLLLRWDCIEWIARIAVVVFRGRWEERDRYIWLYLCLVYL